jgi:uncharacterized membrane protein YkoI
MNVIRSALLMLCAATALAATPLALVAAPPSAHTLSMDEAVKSAEARFHATVVKAETQKEGARTIYVLRLYNKSAGKVWSVRMDAANGAVVQ